MLRSRYGRLPATSEADKDVSLSPGTEDLFLNDLQHIMEDIEVSSKQKNALTSEDEGSSFEGVEGKRYSEKELHEIWGKSRGMAVGIPECIAVSWRQPPENCSLPMFQHFKPHQQSSSNETANNVVQTATPTAVPAPFSAPPMTSKRSELSPADQLRLSRTIHLMGIDASQPRKSLFDLVTSNGERPMRMYRFCGEVNERRTTRFAFIEMEDRQDALACVSHLHLKSFGANILQCAMAKNPIFQGVTVGSDTSDGRIGGKQKMTKVGPAKTRMGIAEMSGNGQQQQQHKGRRFTHGTLFASTSSAHSSSLPSTAESSPCTSPSGSTGMSARTNAPWATYSVRA